MFKCKECKWLYTEIGAGLIDYCGNEELSEEEHDKYRNKGEGECPYFKEDEELPKMCYSLLPSNDEIIIIKNGVNGYFETNLGKGTIEQINKLNEKINVSPEQHLKMLSESMFKW